MRKQCAKAGDATNSRLVSEMPSEGFLRKPPKEKGRRKGGGKRKSAGRPGSRGEQIRMYIRPQERESPINIIKQNKDPYAIAPGKYLYVKTRYRPKQLERESPKHPLGVVGRGGAGREAESFLANTIKGRCPRRTSTWIRAAP